MHVNAASAEFTQVVVFVTYLPMSCNARQSLLDMIVTFASIKVNVLATMHNEIKSQMNEIKRNFID
jgi:hypothetical protein